MSDVIHRLLAERFIGHTDVFDHSEASFHVLGTYIESLN